MKKIKIFFLMFALITVFIVPGMKSAFGWIGDRYENEEAAFTSIMREMCEEQGFDYTSYTFQKTALYKIAGELSGYCYEFTLDGLRDGFVLMVKVDYGEETFYDVTEIFTDSKSPFYYNEGVNIYPTFTKYISCIGGAYFDLATNLEIAYESVQEMEAKGFGFCGGNEWYGWTERIDYTTRSIQKDEIAIGLPGVNLSPTYGINGCAVIGGNNVITYWTYYKPDLMPGYTTGQYILGKYYWFGNSPQASALSNELYLRMGTNTTGPGTTIPQFKNGIISYAAAFGGYSVAFRSAMTNNQYDMAKMLTEFAAGRPVVLFMDPQFNIVPYIDTYTGPYNLISNINYLGSHVMVACGRHIYTWYSGGGNVIRQISFLRVAACFSEISMGWIRLNEGWLSINEALSVEII